MGKLPPLPPARRAAGSETNSQIPIVQPQPHLMALQLLPVRHWDIKLGKWLTGQKASLPSKGTSMGWRGGLRRISQVQPEVQSPAPGEERHQAPGRAGGCSALKQLCREGPGSPGGHRAEREAAMGPCCKAGQPYLGLW